MVDFGSLFGGQKKEEKVGSRGIPIEEVKKLRQAGKSDREIIIELKNKGYSFQEIEKAIVEVTKGGIEFGEQKVEKKEGESNIKDIELPSLEKIKPKNIQPQGISLPSHNICIPTTQEDQYTIVDLLEEVVEGVVEEKMENIEKRFEEIEDKVKKQSLSLKDIQAKNLKMFESEKEKLEKIENELEKLEETIGRLSIKLKVIEKALTEFLPDIIEKARSLVKKEVTVKEEKEEKEEELF